MIHSRRELIEYINEDIVRNSIGNTKSLYSIFVKDEQFWIRKYLKYLRLEEYYTNAISKNRKYNILIAAWYTRKKNAVGRKINVVIAPNCVGKGIAIFHSNVVINSCAKVGDNCSFHGNNCIGNNGISDDVPELGNNIDVGYAATIIGKIKLADNIRIGANSVVTKSCEDSNCVLVGVPARRKGIGGRNG